MNRHPDPKNSHRDNPCFDSASRHCATPPASVLQWSSWLCEAGVLPTAEGSSSELLARYGPGSQNLAPVLLRSWNRCLRQSPAWSQSRRTVSWLEAQIAAGAAITWGLPGNRDSQVTNWVGRRLIFWPRGIPTGRRVGIVSSRLGRPREKHPRWFAAFRELCRQLPRDNSLLLTACGTVTDPYLQRCGELFAHRLVRFVLPPSASRHSRAKRPWFPQTWMDAVAGTPESPWVWPAVVSPPIPATPIGPWPLRDQILIAGSDILWVLRLRQGGHVEGLLKRLLASANGNPAGAVHLAVGRGLVTRALAETLEGRGVCRANWTVPPVVSRTNVAAKPTTIPRGTTAILPASQIPGGDFLTHCTRAADGPWPDQTEADYLDALILGREDADHSSLATLGRIASNQLLIASAAAIRGSEPVVCFTSVPLAELNRLHTFRAHRRRWDFAPHGISINRKWLEDRGARPAIYGDAAMYEQLEPSQRPFFQRIRGGKRDQFAWLEEREWRHQGNLSLHELPRDAAFLFVPTQEQARWLESRSRWPIVVIEW